MTTNLRQRFVSLLVLALLVTPAAVAQTPTGAIEGVVTDPSGAVVPGAKVTVTEPATNRAIRMTTNDSGIYSARNLLPGVYSVKVEKEGFAAKETRSINVSAGSVVNGAVQLEIGRTTDVVQVEASAVATDTVRQTVDSVITEKEIRDLPSFTRNFLDLATLAPGVISRDGENIDPTKAVAYRAIGINGRSGTGTRIQIDGIDVTDETVGTTLSNISQDSVSEFQLTRSSLDPSTSLTSSGAISIISRSGSNDFHGSTFFDFFNQDMSARLNFNKEAEPINRKRTGVSVGGPVAKDKLFFFANWERHYQTQQKIQEVPQFPQLSGSAGFPVGIRYVNGRLDWNATPVMRMFYRFNHSWDVSTGGTNNSPFQNLDWTNTHTIGVDLNSSRTTNSFRFGYLNFNNQIVSKSLGKPFPAAGGLEYNLSVGPYNAGPNTLAPQETYQDNQQLSYDGSLLWRKHSLRYGFTFNHIVLGGYANFNGPLQVSGTYDADALADLRRRGLSVTEPLNFPLESFNTGPNNGFFTVEPAHGFAHGGHFNDRYRWFVQDSVRATRRLTLNLGVASFGFAYDVTGKGRTVVRGGFYKAYEMNIYNNVIFDESAMIPPGIGPDAYDVSGVFGPDGTPINVDGKHPDGNYEDLIGLPLKDVVGTIAAVHRALNTAYTNFKFDPSKGSSLFTQTRGLQIAAMQPGNQYKVPYALQFNIGVQHEIRRGTVISVDYVVNRGVGLPMLYADFERRRDAGFLNVTAARTAVNNVLRGQSVDQYLAANPAATISRFGLVNDTIWAGVTGAAFTRAEFNAGGFSMYRGLQFQLRGRGGNQWKFRDTSYILSYALARNDDTQGAGRVEFRGAALNNRNFNDPHYFGPNGLDFTSIFRAAAIFTAPGGVRLNSNWSFRTAPPLTLTIPNLGGPIAGAQGFFGTDLNGDGGRGTTPRGDLIPGLDIGQFGRSVKSFDELNQIISGFNSTYAGKLTPHGQALVAAGLFSEAQLARLGAVVRPIPMIPTGNPYPFLNQFFTDLRIDRPIKIREGWVLTPFAEVFNLFNHAPVRTYGGLTNRFGALNFDYSKAGPGEKSSDLDLARGRQYDTRKVQVGFAFRF
ncbi:MAG: TonB-dependent receptor [Candidatus Solibacter usitatus]|nr:TonB-dependent receptor [Candidatus Solibacter usitatus]